MYTYSVLKLLIDHFPIRPLLIKHQIQNLKQMERQTIQLFTPQPRNWTCSRWQQLQSRITGFQVLSILPTPSVWVLCMFLNIQKYMQFDARCFLISSTKFLTRLWFPRSFVGKKYQSESHSSPLSLRNESLQLMIT